MPILYNCRHSGDQYRITKFDSDMNPQASYLCTLEECECPAGVRPMCRHRQMLSRFITRGHVGDEWFFDFDRGGWVQMGEEWKRQEPELTGFQEEQILMGFHQPDMIAALKADGEKLRQLTGEDHGPYFPDLPEGVTMIVLDSPDKVVDVHNAIAEAVGEPEAYLKPPSPTHMKRRF